MKTTKRKVLFTSKDKKVIRTELNLPGNMLSPPLLLLYCGKLYRNTGSGLECNFYHEVPEEFMIVDENNQ